jgi:hypothetical protein
MYGEGSYNDFKKKNPRVEANSHVLRLLNEQRRKDKTEDVINYTFTEFVNIAPEELQNYIEKAKITPQSKRWHPEAPDDDIPHNVYTHIKIVFNRAKRTNDISMVVSAFFHDLGKTDTTTKRSEDVYSTHGHEFVSARLVEKYKDWIESLGANYDIVYYVVLEHMRAKRVLEMNPNKRRELQEHPFYRYVDMFTEFDNMKTNYSDDLND